MVVKFSRTWISSGECRFKAILSVLAHFGMDDDEAYQLLRAESTNRRVSIEDLSELIASNGDIELKRAAVTNKGSFRQMNRRWAPSRHPRSAATTVEQP